MNSLEIAPKIYWVGYTDWNIRNFHGYQTHRGTTYNAYLIVDEKVALIDSVKAGYSDDMLEKISERIDPSKIDYIVSNHTEPDHSSEIGKVLELAPNAQVVATEKGMLGLERYFNGNWNYRVVKTGSSLELGENTLEFISTPMLHWPDSMFTYIPEKKLLFSMDAFGQHLATSKRFDYEIDYDVLIYEAKVYFANILMHLGSIAAKTLEKTADMAIETVAPSHGVIWQKHLPDIIAAYKDWAVCKPKQKALIIYDTMWQSTHLMAKTIADTLINERIEVKFLKLGENDLTMIITEVLDAAAVIVGTPTLNNNMLPTVAGFITYLKGLNPKNKLGFAFGSHGWNGRGAKQVHEILTKTEIEVVSDPIRCQYHPDQDTFKECQKVTRALAMKIKENQ